MAVKTPNDMLQAPDIFARGASPAKGLSATPAVTLERERAALKRTEAGERFRARWRVRRTKGDPQMLPAHVRKSIPKNVQRFMPTSLVGDPDAKPAKKKKAAKRAVKSAAKKKGAKRAAAK